MRKKEAKGQEQSSMTWRDQQSPGYKEITLHGDRELMHRRVEALNKVALTVRISDPETYLLLLNLMAQIADQIYFEGDV